MNLKILMLSYETDTIEYVPYDSIYMKLYRDKNRSEVAWG